MAEVKNSVMGNISGRIGNMVFWGKNSKQFISSRPRHYKASKSKAAKTGRNNFALRVKLAKLINSIPVLKEIWSNAKVDGTDSYHRIMKYNSKSIKEGSLTVSTKITPKGLFLSLSSASIQNDILQLTFTFQQNTNIKFPLALYIFFYFKEYGKSVYSISEKIESASPDGSYSLNIGLNSIIKKAIKKDLSPIIYISLAGLVSYKRKIYWSDTASTRIEP